jgi:hypothetical protein
MYLQSIKSVKHMPQSPLTGQFERKADIQGSYSSFVHGVTLLLRLSVRAIIEHRWRISASIFNEFLSPVPESPTQIGLIGVKNKGSKISHLSSLVDSKHTNHGILHYRLLLRGMNQRRPNHSRAHHR